MCMTFAAFSVFGSTGRESNMFFSLTSSSTDEKSEIIVDINKNMIMPVVILNLR